MKHRHDPRVIPVSSDHQPEAAFCEVALQFERFRSHEPLFGIGQDERPIGAGIERGKILCQQLQEEAALAHREIQGAVVCVRMVAVPIHELHGLLVQIVVREEAVG
eukprot:2729140-Prymnesium_polylepis.1